MDYCEMTGKLKAIYSPRRNKTRSRKSQAGRWKTTATQLHQMLNERDYNVSILTVLSCRTALGWSFRGSAYCQLSCEANKQNVWTGHTSTYTKEKKGFRTLSRQTSGLCSWRCTGSFAAGSGDSHHGTNPGTCKACVILLPLPSACS